MVTTRKMVMFWNLKIKLFRVFTSSIISLNGAIIFSLSFALVQAEELPYLVLKNSSSATSTPLAIKRSISAATSTPLTVNDYKERIVHIGFDKRISFSELERYAKKFDIEIHGIYLYADGLTMSHRVFNKEKNNGDIIKDAINTLKARLARSVEMDVKEMKGHLVDFRKKNNLGNDHLKKSIVVLNRQEQFLTVLDKFNDSTSLIYGISANRTNLVADLGTDVHTKKQLDKGVLTREDLYSFKPKMPVSKQLYAKYNSYSSIATIAAMAENISKWEKRKGAKK